MPRRARSPILDEAPQAEEVTEYDRQHLSAYLRLLDAAEAGAGPEEMARKILEVDAAIDSDRARRIAESHLARARWFSAHGYRLLAAKK